MNQQGASITRYLNNKIIQKQKLIDEESDNDPIIDIQIEIDEKRAQNHQQLLLDQITVYFPQQPYSVQSDYMKHVIMALNKKQNALLQSPTGTGKTLALLCASLAWLKWSRAKLQDRKDDSQGQMLKIIYASRTHAQLKQVAKELKQTVYKPKIAMLGSRDHLCIKSEFANYKGSVLNQECKRAAKSSQCKYFSKDKTSYLSLIHSKDVMDIEEIKKFGNQNQCCPYYFERSRKEYADILLMPYNYLLEKDFTNIVDIENCIIIFDEAHNLQSTAEEGSSFFISHKFIIDAEKELDNWIQEIESISLFQSELEQRLAKYNLKFSIKDYRSIAITIKIFAQYIETLKSSEVFTKQQQYQSNEIKDLYWVMDAQKIFKLLQDNTIDQDNVFRLQDPKTYNYTCGINTLNINNYVQHSTVLLEIMNERSSIPAYHFEAWSKFIGHIAFYLNSQNDFLKFGKIDSYHNPINNFKLSIQLDTTTQAISINMWCLDPSIAFKRLLAKSIYSMILTSGTLAPFDSWQSELRVPFDIQLSNPHVIDVEKNVLAHASTSYNFSFARRSDDTQIEKLGVFLLGISRVVPNGILVIFASYALMNKIKSKWYFNKLLLRLNEVKQCLWEPQQSSEMAGIFLEFSQVAKTKGAIMFAVQRGKVAEGIDFSDDLCRAVVLVGVPYPPKQDKKVDEKQKYLDLIYKDSEFLQEARIKSYQWYVQQAIRSTNQAVGRVIRHVQDFGAVFLCDQRFNQGDIKTGMSDWLKPAIKQWTDDGDVIKKTSLFFQNVQNRMKNLPEDYSQVVQEVYKPEPLDKKRKPVQFFGLTNNDKIEQLNILKNTIQQEHQLKVDQINRQIQVQKQQYQQHQQHQQHFQQSELSEYQQQLQQHLEQNHESNPQFQQNHTNNQFIQKNNFINKQESQSNHYDPYQPNPNNPLSSKKKLKIVVKQPR